MKKVSRLFRISLFLLVVLVVLLCYYRLLMKDWYWREMITILPADLTVNGHQLKGQAKMYWYGKAHQGPARAEYAFLPALESLGCVIEGEEAQGPYEIRIRAGDQVFELRVSDDYGYGAVIYADGVRVIGATMLERPGRGKLYLDVNDTQKVLAALGFEQISCEIDDKAMTVRLTAIVGW